MAQTRDIVIGVIIGAFFLIFFFITALVLLSGGVSDGFNFSGLGDKVAVVRVEGEILGSREICRQLDRWADDDNVRAIVLHINSPGGVVAPAQEIYEKVLAVKEETDKPIVASMASVCASGGYYIACAADRVVANPGTLTGSIGVILSWPVYGELMDKIGIQMETIKSGEVKDIGSPYRDASDTDREIMQALVDDAYQQFVEVVVEQRGLSMPEVIQIADGSVFTGRQARDLGLVDTLGTYEDALDFAAELAGMDKDPETVIEVPRRGTSFWDLLGGLFGIDLAKIAASRDAAVYPQLSYLLR
ncbi:MAG: signal peptide peptidase SppA [bacterium]